MDNHDKAKKLRGAEHDQFVLENPCPKCDYITLLASIGWVHSPRTRIATPIYNCGNCDFAVQAKHPDTWIKEFFRLGDDDG